MRSASRNASLSLTTLPPRIATSMGRPRPGIAFSSMICELVRRRLRRLRAGWLLWSNLPIFQYSWHPPIGLNC